MAHTEDTKQNFVELRAKGNSYDTISNKLSVSKPTLIQWSSELEYEISNYKAIEREALRENYLASKEHRIKILGSQLKMVREELKNRDLSEVSTNKLIEPSIKLSDALTKDVESLEFTGDGIRPDLFTSSWAA